jgi:16S rRNA (cytosine967-C5)-methyltransferase
VRGRLIAPARRAAFAALGAVDAGRDLGDALESARAGLGDPRDLALLHELVIGTLRWQRRLDHALGGVVRGPLERLDAEVLRALRLGAYQLLFLSRVPAAAAVHESVALARAARKSSAAGLVNAVLRRLAAGDGRALPPRPSAPVDAAPDEWIRYLAVTHAHPEWLVARWLERVGLDAAERWLAFNNRPPPVALRANPLRVASREDAARALAAEGIVTTPSAVAPWGLVVASGSVAGSTALGDGVCVIQDEGSQLAGHLAPVGPGDRVLDVCAAPGGKTLIYAAASGPAHVVGTDVRAARVRLLRDTLRRGLAADARVVHIDAAEALPFAAAFDVVVVDAPCSGLGTLRRDPDIKWRRTADDLRRFHDGQVDLLGRAAAVVRPGGRLVYTTCSTEPEENDAVVAAVLARVPGLVPVDARQVAPPPVQRFVHADGVFRLHPAVDGLEGYAGAILARRPGPLAPGQPV